MAHFAVIKNNTVNNVILADNKEIAEEITGLTCIEYENIPGAPCIGWSYDGTTFTAPVVEEPTEETPAE